MNHRFKCFFFSILFLFCSIIALNAQNKLASDITYLDSNKVDTSKSVVLKRAHSPKLASYLSIALPGAGQFFNRKYWKILIIYGGFAEGIYLNRLFNSRYVMYRNLYREYQKQYTDKNVATPSDGTINFNGIPYPVASILEERNYFRKYRDITIIATSIWYVLNVVDACVDAYFYDYEMTDNLAFKVYPTLLYKDNLKYYAGMSLKISFK